MSLLSYLKSFEVKEGPYNFQSKQYYAKYLIEDENFWNVYESYQEDKFLMEHSILPYSCLRIDIDIKVPDDCLKPKERLYNDSHIQLLIKNINELVSLDYPNLPEDHFISVVFEKNGYKEKDGFHIVYPKLLIFNTFQDGFIVKNLKKLTFHSPYKFTVDSVATKPWVLPGSKKDSTSLLYKITKTYNKSLELIENPFSTRDFSINKVNDGIVLGQFDEEPVIIVKKRPHQKIEEDFHLITEHNLLTYLSDERVEDYNKWIDVGITLFNIGEGDEKFFNLWVEFSKRSDKFNYDSCTRKWRTFIVKGRTTRTLLWWVKQDNPDGLHAEVQTGINHLMYSILFPEDEDELDENNNVELVIKELLKRKLQHLDVAKIFKKKFSGVYTYYSDKSEKSGEWYKFYNGKWNLVPKELILKEIETLKPYINRACKDIIIDKAYINNINQYFVKFQTHLSESLANQTFINSTLKSCQTELYDDEYGKKIDKNKHLLGCNNGVLDFEKEIFRESTPDDYISMSTGITYKEYSERSSEYMYLQKYFEEVFPEIDIRELALDIFASCLIGMNIHKIFVIAVGNHDAGKSATMSLLEKTFGEYADKLDKSIILQKSSAIRSSDARPDLIITKGKRVIITQETGNEQVNVATLKELTGNDTIYARALHKSSSGAITPMFTLFLACNELPRITQNDEATWRRIVILEFQSKFVDGAPKSREDQIKEKTFPIDRHIQERLLKLAPCLLWFLFKRCIRKGFHKNKSLDFTDSILAYKAERRNKNDPIFLFIQDCIVKEEGEEYAISVTDTFNKFKNWFPSTFPGQKMSFSREQFRECVSRHLGKVIKRKKLDCWVNVHFTDDPI